ncbi:glycosyltransferase [Kribbella solani]|uniref:glycosyltransferase n=1 Tax=Kribbella solani TaxID=236067 RepID=UPI0029A5FB6D|nr:glycosyltransferase [Kribbella solani]MDX3001467.1 glycosyltransferase [Kribbella solani]
MPGEDVSPEPFERAVACVIPAKDEADRIATTVDAVHKIIGVDLVVVVDDGSTDRTAEVAERVGAVVVRHERNRGKAAAMESGAAAVAERDGARPRHLLFLDADLTDTAAAAGPLIEPVQTGRADMTIGTLPAQVRADGSKAGGHGFVVRLSRSGIQEAIGWAPEQPLSGQRCLTRAAFDSAVPLAFGFGVETALTIDLGRKGFRILEVPIDVRHRATGTDLRGQLHRAKQYRHVRRALAARSALPADGGGPSLRSLFPRKSTQ